MLKENTYFCYCQNLQCNAKGEQSYFCYCQHTQCDDKGEQSYLCYCKNLLCDAKGEQFYFVIVKIYSVILFLLLSESRVCDPTKHKYGTYYFMLNKLNNIPIEH